jgi:hypothetical protein
VSRTRGLAVVRDRAQVVAEAARGLGPTAVVDPDQERRHMAAAPDPHQERAPIAAAPDPDQPKDRMAAAPDPDREQARMAAAPERGQIAADREPDQPKDHTAAAPERGQIAGGREPDQEQSPMVAGRAPAPRRAAADLHRAKRAVDPAQHPGSTVGPAQDLDRAAHRGQNRGSTAVRAG